MEKSCWMASIQRSSLSIAPNRGGQILFLFTRIYNVPLQKSYLPTPAWGATVYEDWPGD